MVVSFSCAWILQYVIGNCKKRKLHLLDVIGLPILATGDDERLRVVIGHHDSDAIHSAVINHPMHDRILLLVGIVLLCHCSTIGYRPTQEKKIAKMILRKVSPLQFLAQDLQGFFCFFAFSQEPLRKTRGGLNSISTSYIIGQFNSHNPPWYFSV